MHVVDLELDYTIANLLALDARSLPKIADKSSILY